jgi:hypothetical protein
MSPPSTRLPAGLVLALSLVALALAAVAWVVVALLARQVV